MEICNAIQIHEDLSVERSGTFRAFYAADEHTSIVCTMVGYCSPYGPFRTIKACVTDARKRDATTPIYRNGKRIA
jgi:hypothetical protein